MLIPKSLLEVGAECYWVFAFDEGSPEEIRQARINFNECVREAFEEASKSALVKGIHRPTSGEFRESFISAVRVLLRKKGKLGGV